MDDDEASESYTMEKALILEAWSKYRPRSQENSPADGREVGNIIQKARYPRDLR